MWKQNLSSLLILLMLGLGTKAQDETTMGTPEQTQNSTQTDQDVLLQEKEFDQVKEISDDIEDETTEESLTQNGSTDSDENITEKEDEYEDSTFNLLGNLDAEVEDLNNTVTVRTFLGSIMGIKLQSVLNSTYYTFKGIPYAQPPVGNLRFMPPLPASGWGHLDARSFRSKCPQIDGFFEVASGDEDCLHLNVYTPHIPSEDREDVVVSPQELRPVMVFIHGGGFEIGSGNDYIPVSLVEKDVVVVTLNYRLGALGFTSFGNDIVSGNMGLRDQIEALKWIQRFIADFGGDAKKVTIFGESAGGISVHALYLSPQTSGLFSGAIAQSGTILSGNPSVDVEKNKQEAMKMSSQLGCEADNLDSNLLNCLQKIPLVDILSKTTQNSDLAPNYIWGPVTDVYSSNPVLPTDPLIALQLGAFHQVPLMTGTLKNEGALFLKSLKEITEDVWQKSTALSFVFSDNISNSSLINPEKLHVADILRKYYTDGEFEAESQEQGWVDFLTDTWFLSPDQKTAELTSKIVANVYNYQINFADQFSLSSLFYGNPDNSLAPVHGDELPYLFSEISVLPVSLTPTEEKFADLLTTYWTNFAKYGNPSPFVTDNIELWLPYSDKKNYMDLKLEPEMKQNLEPERMLLWQRLIWDQMEKDLKKLGLYQRLTGFLLGQQYSNLL